ncbi:hypothetical protein BY458DRAFT_590274 [Sporodiniella umbellata]|nr:hypothetical protein BY458DRAFT_590274 [Sporodiniella umbellata]
MYTRSTSAYENTKTHHWVPFKKHTSQKITPLVRFYEKSAGVEKPLIEYEESLDSLSSSELSLEHELELEEEQYTEDSLAVKSLTCPDLSLGSNRPLPPLPVQKRQRMTRVLSKGQMHLKRTIAVPVQRLLASPPIHNLGAIMSKKYQSAQENIFRLQNQILQNHLSLTSHKDQPMPKEDSNRFIYESQHDHCNFIRNQVEESNLKEQSPSNQKVFVAPKRIMYCKVVQIINVGSERDCEYELFVYHNGIEQVSQRGSLHKVTTNASADQFQQDALKLEVKEPFSLTFAVSARYTNTRIRDGLSKILSSLNKTTQSAELPPTGYTVLNFENPKSTQNHGIQRLKLTKGDERRGFFRWFNIEIVVDIKIVDELPASVQKLPWAHMLTSVQGDTRDQDREIIQNPTQVKLSQQHCQAGDYLTIYTRGMAHPAWKRFWVSMEGSRLVFYDFSHKNSKEPLSTLSLIPLQHVNKPSIDDCENVGIARKIGLTLQFDRLKAVLSDDVRFDEGETLEGKMFVYCDNEANAVHWRRALTAYGAMQSESTFSDVGVDLRYLW